MRNLMQNIIDIIDRKIYAQTKSNYLFSVQQKIFYYVNLLFIKLTTLLVVFLSVRDYIKAV